MLCLPPSHLPPCPIGVFSSRLHGERARSFEGSALLGGAAFVQQEMLCLTLDSVSAACN